MTTTSPTIGVIGSGAWGTALALVAVRAGRKTLLWGRDADTLNEIQNTQRNSKYLPNLVLNPVPQTVTDLAAVMVADVVLLTIPAQQLRAVAEQIKPHVRPEHVLLICAKGVELATGKLMSEIMSELLPGITTAILSGPNIAREIASDLPAAATIACANEATARNLCSALSSRTFRCYPSTDITGVALAGAMKNVMTMAAGIVIGFGLGENARAALLSRGLAEMMRLCTAMGGRAESMMGLSGVGDLSLTSTRNYSFGVALGQGKSMAELTSGSLTEGVATAEAIMLRAQQYNIELPITGAVTDVLSGRITLPQAVDRVLARPVPHQ